MRFWVQHRLKGRVRLSVDYDFGPAARHALREQLQALPGVQRAYIYKRNNDVVLEFSGPAEPVLRAVQRLDVRELCRDFSDIRRHGAEDEDERELFDVFYEAGLRRLLTHTLVPAPLKAPVTFIKSLQFLPPAWRALHQGRLTVEVLDATAIVISQLMGDYPTASSIIFLLRLGEDLEDWVEANSRARLEHSLSFISSVAWVERGGVAVQLPVSEVQVGDRVQVRAGAAIPLDGEVVSGGGMVSEATLTGEPLPRRKDVGDEVYASTVLESGELTLRVSSLATETRIAQMVRLMTEADSFQSPRQQLNAQRADALVIYNFLGAFITYALTRSAARAVLFLLVDFSCVLKISTPIVVLSAMRQMGQAQVLVKGGRFIEEFAQMDSYVFDKTGTLTTARPMVMSVLPLAGYSREEVIRYAACLEEHFYHPLGRAVVEQAERENITHDEMHGELNYIVSHGIQSEIDGKRTVIGSRHFVLEDEDVTQTPQQAATIAREVRGENLLYFGIDGQLAAVFGIDLPLRENVRGVIAALHAGGKRVVMLTGDNRGRAEALAADLGIDEAHAEVFPEDKHLFVQREQQRGRRVVMVGDGINDSAALRAADIAVVMSESADLAQQVADIVILSDDLEALLALDSLSLGLERRLTNLFAAIVGVNGGLLALGLLNVLPPSVLALAHNSSTIAFSLYSLGDTLPLERRSPSGVAGDARGE